MRRFLGPLLVLLALPLVAADVPLSDRPLAPLPNINGVTAAASPQAVLVVFSSGPTFFAQRLDLQGRPLDETPFPIAAQASGARVIWDGSKWLVFLGGSPVRIVYVYPSGDFVGPLDLNLASFADVAIVDGRVILATREYVSSAGASRQQLYELLPGGSLVSGLERLIHDPRGNWIVGLDGGAGIVTYVLLWGTSPSVRFEVFTSRGINELTVPATSGALNIAFVPSPGGGGLALWNDGGMRGAILRRDETFSAPFAIGPAEVAYEGVRAAARADGWDVLFAPGGKTWIAGVTASGEVDARPIELDRTLVTQWIPFLAVGPSEHLLLEPRSNPLGGIAVRRIMAGVVSPPITIAIGEAAQYGARSAAGGGLDLVVWNEQSTDGRILRATRVSAAGTPLDGAGLLVTADPLPAWGRAYGQHFDVAFDGRAFIVVWVTEEGNPRVVMRTISTGGEMSAPVVLAQWDWIEGVSAAGAGEGRSAIAWLGHELGQSYRSVLVPLTNGEAGTQVEVGSGKLGQSLPRLAANGDRYLAVFNDYTPCRITCAPETWPYGRMFAFDGTPLSDARRLSSGIAWTSQVVSDGRNFFVPWQALIQHALITVGPDFTIGPERALARGGDLSIEGTELRVDHGIVRAVYSLVGDLLRFEPLRIAKGENRAVSLSRERIVVTVPADPARLFIRSLDDPPPAIADLAIVATGAITPVSYGAARATFRVEHRGGAPVSRIELWSSLPVSEPGASSPGSLPTLTLDRVLREGESFEVLLTVYPQSHNPPLWVAADALDPVPGNNVDSYARPPRQRARVVGR